MSPFVIVNDDCQNPSGYILCLLIVLAILYIHLGGFRVLLQGLWYHGRPLSVVVDSRP
jgi:hypothetical protein